MPGKKGGEGAGIGREGMPGASKLSIVSEGSLLFISYWQWQSVIGHCYDNDNFLPIFPHHYLENDNSLPTWNLCYGWKHWERQRRNTSL